MKAKNWAAAAAFIAASGLIVGCSVDNRGDTSAVDKAQAASDALQSQIYQPTNNVEFNNYNRRQKISDDPSQILWCTAYFTNPNVQPITFPIAGKLTSSNKRPYSTAQVQVYNKDSGGQYSPELPGPDKMYGSSGEYRYGFTPAGVYVDFTDISTVCTTQPTVYQATETKVVLTTDQNLSAAASAASAALKNGNPAAAEAALQNGIAKVQK